MQVNSAPRSRSLTPVIASMLIGGVAMWLGAPVLWLYIGSQIKVATESLGFAVIVMMVGSVITIALLVRWLMHLNSVYRDRYEERSGDQPEHTPLEPMLVVTAGLAMAGFSIWFFLFAGANPSGVGF